MGIPQVNRNHKKILEFAMLGDGLVGKTAILRHYKGLPFDPTYQMTIGADFVVKRLNHKNMDLTVQIFDVGGQENFSELRSKYYGRAEAVIIVFDLMRRKTFENIPNWFDEVLRNNDYRLIPLMLIGNKEDLLSDTESVVKKEEIDNYIQVLTDWGKQYDPEFFVMYSETSAKTGYNVKETFQTLMNNII